MVEWLKARTLESNAMDSNLSSASVWPLHLSVPPCKVGFITVLTSWDCCEY